MSESKKDEKPLNLATKLALIGEEVGKVDKTGRNTSPNGGYNFIEYSEVASRIRALLAKHRVIIIPEVQSYEKEITKSNRGTEGFHYILTMNFEIINGDDLSDKLTKVWYGESTDFGDKGVNKAVTAGTKYFLMRLFNISEKGDDPDGETPQEASSIEPVSRPQLVGSFNVSKFKEEIRKLKTDDDIRKYYANARAHYKLAPETQKELEGICAEEIERRVELEAFGPSEEVNG